MMRGRKLFIERLEDRRTLAADFNGDATVDNIDLGTWKFGFGTVAAATEAQGDADGDGDVDGNDFLVFQRQLGPTKNNLIAYRPQGVHPIENPPDAPMYQPFPKRPVSEDDETDADLGPGIRINYDDDNFNGVADAFEIGVEVSRENDLIEVKVERLPGRASAHNRAREAV